MPIRTRFALAASAIALSAMVGLTGCSLSSILGPQPQSAALTAVDSTPVPTATKTPLVFNSVFTDMGSVHSKVMIADQLELELDVWTEQKTHEWFPDSDKAFSFVINVFDQSVSPEAAFANKRKVYMSRISVAAKTTTSSGASTSPFVLDTNPLAVTLDPEALRSKSGLLVTSPKGGFQLEDNRIGQLASDTYGVTLDFAMVIHAETSKGTGDYSSQTIHIPVPVAILPH
ncbi:hypothetical protein [Glaciihabitans sp. dw_435]|uniref:hypothetical protein n=1 Tax=Glaciihabitans sp. dw_435 TaxID=2720081 RepID=UPI001BD4F1E9|nr:hypothetical protein [Glaciihabitans sp. dw_435]